MEENIKRLDGILQEVQDYFGQSSEAEISKKPNPEKWSKKEILGHLIDSGLTIFKDLQKYNIKASLTKSKNTTKTLW